MERQRKVRMYLHDLIILLDGKHVPTHWERGTQGQAEKLQREIMEQYGLNKSDVRRLKQAIAAGRYRICP